MDYRKEIDGLRAVAVIPVIFFHAGFSAFSGGYIGVDVFFVISGYLITSIILREKKTGTFSLMRFYERRARRILPALYFVMMVCLPFAWMWMMPNQLIEFSRSLLAVTFFISNILFYSEADYFALAAELKPLLHTWSLAIEEQFYVLYPMILILLWKFLRNQILAFISLIAIVSFLLTQFGGNLISIPPYIEENMQWTSIPDFAFYLLPTRAWELLIGAIAAIYLINRKAPENIANEILSVIGLSLIIFSIITFDDETPFPSIYTLYPTLGTVLIILFATPETCVHKFLSYKLFVGIGIISYSAYLWHQPLFAFARLKSLDEPEVYLLITLCFVTFVMAYFSWRFIESPFRNNKIISQRNLIISITLASTAFVSIGLMGQYANGFENRFSLPGSVVKSFSRDISQHNCFDIENIHLDENWLCPLGMTNGPPMFFVFGDSHARTLYSSFNAAAIKQKTDGVFAGAAGCIPFLGVHSLRTEQIIKNCHLLNKRVLNYVRDNNIKKIFLVARWTYYTDGGYDGEDFSYIGKNPSDDRNKDISRRAYIYGLNKTLEDYEKNGVEVIFVHQVPQQKYDPQLLYYKVYDKKNKPTNESLYKSSVDYDTHYSLQKFVRELVQQINHKGRIKEVFFDDIFCDDIKCLVGVKDKSFYADDDHISAAGVKLTTNRIVEYLN